MQARLNPVLWHSRRTAVYLLVVCSLSISGCAMFDNPAEKASAAGTLISTETFTRILRAAVPGYQFLEAFSCTNRAGDGVQCPAARFENPGNGWRTGPAIVDKSIAAELGLLMRIKLELAMTVYDRIAFMAIATPIEAISHDHRPSTGTIQCGLGPPLFENKVIIRTDLVNFVGFAYSSADVSLSASDPTLIAQLRAKVGARTAEVIEQVTKLCGGVTDTNPCGSSGTITGRPQSETIPPTPPNPWSTVGTGPPAVDTPPPAPPAAPKPNAPKLPAAPKK